MLSPPIAAHGESGRRIRHGRCRQCPSAGKAWDIGIFLTDLPRRAPLSPVSVELNPERRIALVSLPALGSRRLRRRVEKAVVGIVGRPTDGIGAAISRR